MKTSLSRTMGGTSPGAGRVSHLQQYPTVSSITKIRIEIIVLTFKQLSREVSGCFMSVRAY